MLAAAIPGGAFLVTWYLTFRLAHAAVPDGYLTFDNVPTVWLFVASVGGPGVLLAYGLSVVRPSASPQGRRWTIANPNLDVVDPAVALKGSSDPDAEPALAADAPQAARR